MKKVFISGADGFIASNVCNEMLKSGYEILGVDNHSKYKNPYTEHHKHPNMTFHLLDLIKDVDDVSQLVKSFQPDYIVHLAAVIGGIRLFHELPFTMIHDNAIMDANILKLATQLPSLKRFVSVSSSMVFERCDIFPTKEEVLEKIPVPGSSYGFSKLSLEKMTEAAHLEHNLPYTVIRAFNAVGLGENDFLEDKDSHVLPDLIRKCWRTDEHLSLLGSGNQTRAFTNTRDIARGIRIAMEHENGLNNDFNISSPKETSIKELAEIVWNTIHPNKELVIVNEIPYKHDTQRRVPDVSKSERLLGFKAEISLEESVEEVIDYMRSKYE